MRRKISVLLVLSLLAGLFCTVAPACTNKVENDKVESTNKSGKAPLAGAYQWIDNSTELLDEMESNNSFGDAYLLKGYNGEKPQNYTVSKSATLHKAKWTADGVERTVDEDIYRFDVMGNAHIKLELSDIPEGCDYDVVLFRHDNIKNATAVDIIQVAVSENVANTAEEIVVDSTPGTYYIWVYSKDDSFDDNAEYSILCDVEYKAQDVSLAEMRYDKGAKAALWISDNDVLGLDLFETDDWSEVAQNDDPFNEYIMTDAYVEHMTLYIFDHQLSKDLWESLVPVWNALYDGEYLQGDCKVELAYLFHGNEAQGEPARLNITVDVFQRSWFMTTEKTVVDDEIEISPLAAVILEKILFAGEQHEISKYAQYVHLMMFALESSAKYEHDQYERISWYFCDPEKHDTNVASYKLEVGAPYEGWNYEVDAWREDSVTNGTVYGIISAEDATKALDRRSTDLTDVNTGKIYDIGLEVGFPNTLNVGEYHWYKFTAPSQGTYVFYTENSSDMYGELFNEVVPAMVTDGMVVSGNDHNGTDDFRIEYTLSAGQTVYLRVTEYGRDEYGLYVVKVTKV